MLIELVSHYGLALVFANVLLGQLGLPLPIYPTLIVTASLMPASGGPLIVAVATVAALIGDTAWFLAGRRGGYRVIRVLCRMSLSADTCVRRTELTLERWGVRILVIAKFVPGLSLVTLPLAGALRVRWQIVLFFDLLGVLLWAGVGVTLGRVFSHQLSQLLDVLDMLGHGVLLVVALALGIYLTRRLHQRRRLLQRLRMARMSVDDLYQIMQEDAKPVIVDVRTSASRLSHPYRIPGAITLPAGRRGDEFHGPLSDIPRDSKVVLYCTCPNEISAAMVANQLIKLGFADVNPLLGGLDAWQAAGHPVENSV